MLFEFLNISHFKSIIVQTPFELFSPILIYVFIYFCIKTFAM